MRKSTVGTLIVWLVEGIMIVAGTGYSFRVGYTQGQIHAAEGRWELHLDPTTGKPIIP